MQGRMILAFAIVAFVVCVEAFPGYGATSHVSVNRGYGGYGNGGYSHGGHGATSHVSVSNPGSYGGYGNGGYSHGGHGATSHVSVSNPGSYGGYGNGAYSYGGHAYQPEHHAPAHYKFDYSVHDPHTHDIKNQWESRDGDVVKGSYSLLEADGTTRTVDYTADHHNGFNAVVRKSGHAHHPQVYGHGAGYAHY